MAHQRSEFNDLAFSKLQLDLQLFIEIAMTIECSNFQPRIFSAGLFIQKKHACCTIRPKNHCVWQSLFVDAMVRYNEMGEANQHRRPQFARRCVINERSNGKAEKIMKELFVFLFSCFFQFQSMAFEPLGFSCCQSLLTSACLDLSCKNWKFGVTLSCHLWLWKRILEALKLWVAWGFPEHCT